MNFIASKWKSPKEKENHQRAAGVIAVFLFNSHGEIFIQKRAYTKNHNPGLFDKSIGGHIQEGDTPDYTTMVETIQEMQTPSMVLKNRDDFLKTFNLLKDYLKTVSIIQYIKTESNVLSRVINQKKVNIANVSSLYFGVYDGRIRPVDREAKGVLWYSFNELIMEMDKMPEAFTQDLHFYVKKYEKEMRDFISVIAS